MHTMKTYKPVHQGHGTASTSDQSYVVKEALKILARVVLLHVDASSSQMVLFIRKQKQGMIRRHMA